MPAQVANATATPRRPWSERAARLVFWILAYVLVFRTLLTAGTLATGDPESTVESVDFAALWTAARLTLAGQPLTAFDPAALLAASGLSGEGAPKNLLWLYPPHFLVPIAPLGALPYWAAWSVFNLTSVVALALAARGPARPLPGGWRLIIVSPIMIYSVLDIGQTSALWAAGLIAALWMLQHQRAAAAGFLIALLTMKPHLGLLIPIALAADRQWRTIGWATGFALVMMLLATLVFGAAYWMSFVSALADVSARLKDGVIPAMRVVSVYGLGRSLGLDHGAALWLHWPVALALAATVGWVWSRRDVGADLKAALLCAVIPLATPYAYYYEMVTTLAAGLFLVRDGFGRGLLARLWLVVIWLGPIPAIYTPALTDRVTLPSVPIILVTVVICLVRVWRCLGSVGAQKPPIEPARERHARSP